MSASPRKLFVALFLTLLVLSLAGQRSVAADMLDADAIKVTLGTASPEEDGFIDQVVAKVDSGKLPRDLFDSTFLWARKRPKRRFQYFKYALITRAADRGITL